jgi:oxygen-independent coproporphyrinogen-3 oxidase
MAYIIFMSAGIYVHIPFCIAKCVYCDFYSVVDSPESQNRFVASLIREIELQSESVWGKQEFDTIYFGGGTPSIFKPEQLGAIIESLKRCFNIADNAEITIEINPETVEETFFEKLKNIGVNRISIGVQSFDDNELRTLGRIHNSQTALKAIDSARRAGFDNFSIDLIFGIPGQSLESWRQTLDMAVKQNPVHISAYGLTIESGTPLESLINSGKLIAVDDDAQVDMYRLLLKTMAQNGLIRYEISNFARPGKESRHNLKYWRDCNYLGFGPAAHTYDGSNRCANVRDLAKYISLLGLNQIPIGFRERLSSEQKTMERLLMGIRQAEGVELASVISAIDKDSLESLCEEELVSVADGKLLITEKGLPVSDKIIAQLIKI